MYVDIVICKAILFLLLKHLFWRQIDSSLNEFDQVWARIFLKIGLQGAKCKNSAYFTHCTPIYNWRPMLVAVVGRGSVRKIGWQEEVGRLFKDVKFLSTFKR